MRARADWRTITSMTESDRLALVAIACTFGVDVERAWEIVDQVEPTSDLRSASLQVAAAAKASAWAVYGVNAPE
ncbi:hypothetical protein SEA_GUDMIT_30 [Gordonia phage Gudmit]|nr:hypothetical protein SEA_GUDMIT_30 [Gordonia phage Gudmit]